MPVPQDLPGFGEIPVEAFFRRPRIRALDRKFADPLARKREIVQAIHAAPPERRIAHVLVEEDAARLHARERVGKGLLLRCRRNVMHHVDHRDGAIALIGQPGLDRAMLEGELRRSAGGAQALGGGVRGRDG